MEALDVVKQMVEDGQISQEVAEKYCPEIKKYKDEIVKKQILELIRQHSVNSDRCMMENWVYAHARLQPFKPSDEQLELLREVQQALLGKDCHNRFVNFMHELKKLREKDV